VTGAGLRLAEREGFSGVMAATFNQGFHASSRLFDFLPLVTLLFGWFLPSRATSSVKKIYLNEAMSFCLQFKQRHPMLLLRNKQKWPNKALHLTATPLRPIATGELWRSSLTWRLKRIWELKVPNLPGKT